MMLSGQRDDRLTDGGSGQNKGLREPERYRQHVQIILIFESLHFLSFFIIYNHCFMQKHVCIYVTDIQGFCRILHKSQ